LAPAAVHRAESAAGLIEVRSRTVR
jgi:hypothetical protein